MTLSFQQVLQELSELNLSEYPDQKAHELIRQLGQYACIVTIIPSRTLIVRARVNCNFDEFSKKRDLSYKPQECNNTYQRASTRYKTMFYGCLNPDGNKNEKFDFNRLNGACEVCKLFWDESITDGEQIITFSFWITTQEIPVVPIIYNFENFPSGKYATKLQEDTIDWFSEYSKEIIQKTNEINRFFEMQFSKEETPNDYDYLLSAIYSERISSNPNPKLAGVLYPSVRTKEHKGKGFNIAISPFHADNFLFLDTVVQCTVYKKSGNIICDNNKQAILTQGQSEFVLTPITDPGEHLGREEVYRRLNELCAKIF